MLGLKTYKTHKWQTLGLAIFIFIGLTSQIISNEKYLLSTDHGLEFFVDKSKVTSGLGAMIPYSYYTIDKDNRNVGPFDKQKISSLYYRHWLGTDAIGRDVLAGLLAGTYLALKLGFLAMLLTMLIGVFFGYLSGYLGDNKINLDWRLILIYLSIISITLFYAIYGNNILKLLASLLFLSSSYWVFNRSKKHKVNPNAIYLPFDLLVIKLIEVMKAIPDIFLVLVLLAISTKPSHWNIIWIIALVRWPTVTRFLRAEILKIKNQNFIASAQLLGLSDWKIFKRHILPLAISPVFIACAFGFSSAILLESTLSFLGIGIPADQVSWGSILNQSRQHFSSWWLALFPGLMIYLVIFLFNSIADKLSDHYTGL